MMLIYTKEMDMASVPTAELESIAAAHSALMEEAKKRGVLLAARGESGHESVLT
jgi:hypothetical protein